MWNVFIEKLKAGLLRPYKFIHSLVGEEAEAGRVKLITALVGVSFLAVLASAVKLIYDYKPQRIIIATDSPGSEYYTFGEAIKKVIETHRPSIRVQLVTDTDGSHDNARKIQRKEVDFALTQNDAPVEESIRTIALLFPEVMHLYVWDKEISQFNQIEKIHVATFPEYSGSHFVFSTLCRYYDLEADTLNVSLFRPEAVYDAFLNKEVDGVFHLIGLGNTAKKNVGFSLKNGARLLSIEQVEALRYYHPFLKPYIIPKGFYNGCPPLPEKDVATAAVHAVLVAHKDVDKGLAYEITRILYESRNELIHENPLAASMKITDSSEEILFPLHPGARQYLHRDRPSFLVRYSDTIALLLSLGVLFGSWTWHLRLRLEQRLKDRADMYNLEIVRIIEHIQEVDSLEELQAVKVELFGIFKQVIKDFDSGKVSSESFQFFAFPWEMAINVIRHKEMLLRNLKL